MVLDFSEGGGGGIFCEGFSGGDFPEGGGGGGGRLLLEPFNKY